MPFLQKTNRLVLLLFIAFLFACETNFPTIAQQDRVSQDQTFEKPKLNEIKSPETRKIVTSAFEQIKVTTEYSQNYYVISYPNGDVPKETGACTDVVIRSFRNAGIDLQKEVHEDMKANFSKYPKRWSSKTPDSNIDHRRVLNLQTFFERKGKSLPITENGKDFEPGDVISWDLNGRGLTHIGVVSNVWNKTAGRYLIIHNIGSGTELEDRLFDWEITGHYRYFGF